MIGSGLVGERRGSDLQLYRALVDPRSLAPWTARVWNSVDKQAPSLRVIGPLTRLTSFGDGPSIARVRCANNPGHLIHPPRPALRGPRLFPRPEILRHTTRVTGEVGISETKPCSLTSSR